MKVLPLEQMKIHVADDGTVVVGAHEHNGYIWWSRLPAPRLEQQEHEDKAAGESPNGRH